VNADSEGFGQYRITIDATLPTGNYLGSITIKDSEANEYSITIRASIYNYTSDTTGNIYGILIDKVTEESVYTANTELDNDGKGQLMFDDVTSGEYYLLLGSDLDNDNFICDEGELCGGYPVLSDMQLLNVNDGNVTGITVVVGPSTNISSQSTTNSNQGTKRNLIN
jgi:serine protease